LESGGEIYKIVLKLLGGLSFSFPILKCILCENGKNKIKKEKKKITTHVTLPYEFIRLD